MNPTENHRRWRHNNPEKVKTWRRRNHVRRKALNRLRIYDHFGRACALCGYFNPLAMDLDHVDPATKLATVSDLLGKTWNKIEPELSKCQLLCANCHRIKTINEHHPDLAEALRSLLTNGVKDALPASMRRGGLGD